MCCSCGGGDWTFAVSQGDTGNFAKGDTGNFAKKAQDMKTLSKRSKPMNLAKKNKPTVMSKAQTMDHILAKNGNQLKVTTIHSSCLN